MDKDIEKDIIKCSRCGLCMEVCPVYDIKKTETSTTRGKFLQLLGLIKKDLKYDKNVAYNLDLCLSCGKCKKVCPSDIDAVKVFSYIKSEFQNPVQKLYYSSFSLKLKLFILKILYKIKYATFFFGKNCFPSLFKSNKKLNKKNNRKISLSPVLKKSAGLKQEKIARFEGCLTRTVLPKLDFAYYYKKEKFKCCALPFYVKGRFDLYEKYKNKNLELFKKYDKIVFDCASCYDTVLNYDNVDKTKIVFFTDFYKDKKISLKTPLKVSYHKPCHLDEKTFREIENILKNIANLEYIPLDNETCCGFGGDFFTRHTKSAHKLSLKKAEDIIKKDVDTVLTSCPACLWSLKYGLKMKKIKNKNQKNISSYDLADFLYNIYQSEI